MVQGIAGMQIRTFAGNYYGRTFEDTSMLTFSPNGVDATVTCYISSLKAPRHGTEDLDTRETNAEIGISEIQRLTPRSPIGGDPNDPNYYVLDTVPFDPPVGVAFDKKLVTAKIKWRIRHAEAFMYAHVIIYTELGAHRG